MEISMKCQLKLIVNAVEISKLYQWKSIWNKGEFSIKYQCQLKLIGNPVEFNEIPMEIELKFQWNTNGSPLEIHLKFNRYFNEILMEIHINLVEISMIYQFKFQ